MTLLDYTTVLPRGSAEPDLSGTPDLMDFVDPEIWERRVRIYADPQRDRHREFHALAGAGRRWHAACRAYFRRVEIENGIEFSNWEVSGETGPGGKPALRITTMLAPDPSGRQYGWSEAHRFVAEPAEPGGRAELVPGWDLTTDMQRWEVLMAVHAWLKATGMAPEDREDGR